MRLKIIQITNQGVPVHMEVLPPNSNVEQHVQRVAGEWNLRFAKVVTVLNRGSMAGMMSGHVDVKQITTIVDAEKHPKYTLSVATLELQTQRVAAPEAEAWRFCPDCGCSWLAHLCSQAALEPEDWAPQPCSECGCKKAVD